MVKGGQKNEPWEYDREVITLDLYKTVLFTSQWKFLITKSFHEKHFRAHFSQEPFEPALDKVKHP